MDLQLENIRKAYGDKQVLRDCTFAFEKGKIYGLLGRNGAGKTTLFNCLTDEVPADGGRALLLTATARRGRLRRIRWGMYIPRPFCRIFLPAMNSYVFLWIFMKEMSLWERQLMTILIW